LRFGIDDIHSVASDSLTDGGDDKKCDIVYINVDDGMVLVAQCYFATKQKPSAPSNKASDLATGLGWLFQAPLKEMPLRLAPAATELRKAIEADAVDALHIWYVHNLPESTNVNKELLTVQSTANAVLKLQYPGKTILVHALEVGATILESWYRDTLSPILVGDQFSLPTAGGFEISKATWKAFVTSVLHNSFTRFITSTVLDCSQ
jgi:hypothetical protein